ncbi:replicative DNA helicase, partial [Candidatus Microgenomates bacterium]|nr:replicative DNA helicase [Candidatus Microgenomates bacterium]
MENKVPPQNTEVEQSLIGCMLIDKEAIISVSAWLLPEHFYDQRHQIVYGAILDLFNDGLPVDLITVVDKLKKERKLPAVGGRTYIAELATI